MPWRGVQFLFLPTWIPCCLSTFCCKDSPFLGVLLWPCINQGTVYVSLFLNSSSPLTSVYPAPVPHHLNHCSFRISLGTQQTKSYLVLQVCQGYPWPLASLLPFSQNTFGNLTGISMILQISTCRSHTFAFHGQDLSFHLSSSCMFTMFNVSSYITSKNLEGFDRMG